MSWSVEVSCLVGLFYVGVEKRDALTFVVGVEDDFGVGLVLGRDSLPEGLEVASTGNDVAVVSAVVVGADDGVCTLTGDVVDLLGEVAQVRSIRCSGHGGRDQTLHKDVDTEDVHARGDEGVISAQGRPDIVRSINTWDVSCTELRTRFIDTEKLELGDALGDFGDWGGESNRGRACGQEKSRETHSERV